MKKIYLMMFLMSTVFFVLIIGCCSSTKAQKGAYGGKVALFSQLFSPVDDLYEPVALMPISLLSETSYDFSYKHNYMGIHVISLHFSGKSEIGWYDKKDRDFEIFINIISERGDVVSKEIKGNDLSGGYDGPSGNGIFLLEYSLPKDYPVDELLHCNIVISKPGPIFVEKCGEPTVTISRASF